MSVSSVAKEIIKSQNKKKTTSPYDTNATVTRVSGTTAYVHIEGGVAETPVQKTINAKAGDKVKVRVSGGKAWITGNQTAPPTDDANALKALDATGALKDTVGKNTLKIQEVDGALNVLSKSTDGRFAEVNIAADAITSRVSGVETTAKNAESAASNAKTTAETAQKDANDAKSTAESAQKDAADAKTAATTAQTTASEAKQTADGFETRVTKVEQAASDAQTTASEAKQTAEGFEVRITAAEDTASDAKTTAETAQQDATDAKSVAESAQKDANDAKTAATSAQTTAEDAQKDATDAKTTAAEAQTTAEDAQTTAETAQNTANTAKASASTAQTAADDAKTAADAAQTDANTANDKYMELKATADGLETRVTNVEGVSAWFKQDSDGLTIGKDDAAYAVRITNDRINFLVKDGDDWFPFGSISGTAAIQSDANKDGIIDMNDLTTQLEFWTGANLDSGIELISAPGSSIPSLVRMVGKLALSEWSTTDDGYHNARVFRPNDGGSSDGGSNKSFVVENLASVSWVNKKIENNVPTNLKDLKVTYTDSNKYAVDISGEPNIATTTYVGAMKVHETKQVDATFAGDNQNIQFSNSKTNYYGARSGWVADNYTSKKSDRRLKDGIEDLDEAEAVEIYDRLKPKKYHYKDRLVEGQDDAEVYRKGIRLGLIAQDVDGVLKEYIPDHGITPKSTAIGVEKKFCPDGSMALEYNDLHALHIAYAHHLEERISQLEERIVKLEEERV